MQDCGGLLQHQGSQAGLGVPGRHLDKHLSDQVSCQVQEGPAQGRLSPPNICPRCHSSTEWETMEQKRAGSRELGREAGQGLAGGSRGRAGGNRKKQWKPMKWGQ